MSTKIDLHSVQAEILRALLFKESARFSELNLTGLTSDHFSFHIGKLLKDGLVMKKGDGYSLTETGKEFANRMDTATKEIERQGKIAVLIVGVKVEDGTPKYLVQQRKKQPYYGYYGFVSGKIGWGQKVSDAAQRELEEETGLIGNAVISGIEHKIDTKDGVVLEDKYFYVCRVENPIGELMREFEGGENNWMTEDELKNIDKVFGDVFEILEMIKGSIFRFEEKEFVVTEY